MTVRELINLLMEEDKEALVGTAWSSNDGMVSNIKGIKYACSVGQSIVVLDQVGDLIGDSELDIV